MEQTGELRAVLADVGVYRRAEVETFVRWSRATILRLRDVTDRTVARARHAEEQLVRAERRAVDAEGRVAELERRLLDAERATAMRERDLEASVGRAMMMVAMRAADGEAAQTRSAFELPRTGDPLWASEDDDIFVSPMRGMRTASGA